jgi:hypothetical protein
MDGWLGERLNGNGFYVTGGKGRYDKRGLAGIMDHWTVSGGVMVGSPCIDEYDWWPTLNLGIGRHWTTTWPGEKRIEGAPGYYKWDLEFGSSGQIGWYYPWVKVSVFRQIEMVFGVGVIF